MKSLNIVILNVIVLLMISSCAQKQTDTENEIEVFETSRSGNQLTKIDTFSEAEPNSKINLNPKKTFQTFTGFGGSFTESSAYLLNQLGAENRQKIIDAYFADSGARYSLTRTHMNSCDFSLGQYSYAPIEGDVNLENFSVEEDIDDLIPMIKDAMVASSEGFNIISSPWTAPPWMKDNNDWVGGKLKPEFMILGLYSFLNI